MKRLFIAISALAVLTASAQTTNLDYGTAATSPVNAITAPAPVSGAAVVLSSGTNQLAGSAAWVYSNNVPKISCQYSRFVTLSQQVALTTAGTGNFISYWNRSDGNITVTNAYALTNVCAGTTPTQASTNIDMGGWFILQLNYVTNANAASAIATNWLESTSQKRGL